MKTRKSVFLETDLALMRLSEWSKKVAEQVGEDEAAELLGLVDNVRWELERLEKLDAI